MIVVGIDPGLSGGIAFIKGKKYISKPMPVLKLKKGKKESRTLDLKRLKNWLTTFKVDYAFIEKVHSMPRQGVASTFKFGYGAGQIEGMLAALGIPYMYFRPLEWQMIMHLGCVGADTKTRSIKAAKKLFPVQTLLATPRSSTPHDGMAEALLIAEYGRRQLCGTKK